MSDVVMPRLSDSMEEGTIVRWLKRSGEVVARGEELVEIETDKATMTYEADAGGPLETLAAEGETLPIGALIARVGGGESGAGARAGAPAASVPAGAADGRRTAAAAVAAPSGRNGGVKASPVARRLARELGVELATLAGSGPGGRIVKADVLAGASAAPSVGGVAQAPAAAAAEDGAGGKGTTTRVEPTRLQQLVARRMAEAKATAPEFAVATEVDMAAAVAARAQLKAAGAEPLPSYNDMVVKAAASALREHPRANGAFKDGAFELYGRVNVGIAVAADDALVVPTVFDADRKSLGAIAAEARALAARVRDGRIAPPELSGGTFTVSNLGMFGATAFGAILNAGQAGILAVGALRETPVVAGGAVLPGWRMTLTLTCDHRILHGADAARFLARVRALLEAPLALAL